MVEAWEDGETAAALTMTATATTRRVHCYLVPRDASLPVRRWVPLWWSRTRRYLSCSSGFLLLLSHLLITTRLHDRTLEDTQHCSTGRSINIGPNVRVGRRLWDILGQALNWESSYWGSYRIGIRFDCDYLRPATCTWLTLNTRTAAL